MEQIYNVFLYYTNDVCSTVGYVAHDYCGSDEQSLDFLKNNLREDFQRVSKLDLVPQFTLSEYNAKCRLGEGHHLFDQLFVEVAANSAPLFISTSVKDGELFFEYSSDHGPLDMKDVSAKLGFKGVMDDWLVKYTDEQGIKLSELIHDDYFLAIKLAFNARHYVSAMKLFVSCIDSLAYIEYGDDRKSPPFIAWLNTYADLAPLGITAAELWELRNGLLHMTNLHSSKVRTSKIRRISFRIGGPINHPRLGADGIYYFDFHHLIAAFAEAQVRWIKTYNIDRSKFAKFVERYDETISDSRLTFTYLKDGQVST